MKLSYRFKLVLIITVSSFLLTTGCVAIYYNYAYNLIIDSLQKNLHDSVLLMSMSLSDEDVMRLERIQAALKPYIKYSDKEIKYMLDGGIINNIPQDAIYSLQSSEDFQIVVKKIRKQIMTLISKDLTTVPDFDSDKIADYAATGILQPYFVMIDGRYKQHKIVQNLASCAYQPGKDWPGNPIGTSWHTLMKSVDLYRKSVYINKELVTDTFGTTLYSTAPILDKKGNTFAYLEVDYAVGKELNKLQNIKIVGFVLIVLSLVVGFILSFFISKRMSGSLEKLSAAATEIKDNNYDVKVDINNDDEFGVLGNVFNQMTEAVKKTTTELRNSNEQLMSASADLRTSNERLMSITADMHDGVGSVLNSIQIATRNADEADLENIHHLANQGMGEVRFLMDAMEYDDCTFDLLKEGIEMLAIDILKPRKISWEIHTDEYNDVKLPFKYYLDIQRVARESFANIIKHSDAEKCVINLNINDGFLELNIFNDGKTLENPRVTSGGRGLNNIRFRIEKYHGEFSFIKGENSFEIRTKTKIPIE